MYEKTATAYLNKLSNHFEKTKQFKLIFSQETKDRLFEWVDGPLVTAMKQGAMFLIDEISLADDSVLERLNSVLEPERAILLAEKGGGDGAANEVEQVVARQGFHVFATMNPGGDFGKKEVWLEFEEFVFEMKLYTSFCSFLGCHQLKKSQSTHIFSHH